MSDYSKEYSLAREVVLEAAEILVGSARVESAIGRDIKLEQDVEVERLIISRLGDAHPILSEESKRHQTVDQSSSYWVLDPIDGSYNFARGLPHFCISLALWKQDKPVFGIVYDVPSATLYQGKVGEGAFRNGAPIRVSQISSLDQACFATGFPSHSNFQTDALYPFLQRVQSFKKVRLFGSAAMSLCYLAAGNVDAYLEDGIMFWDVAAGLAIVQAAGGAVAMTPKSDWQTYTAAAATGDLLQPLRMTNEQQD